MPEVDIDGVNLHYDIEGEGPPLLLIAGLGANSSSWATVKPLLKDRFTCITFDNRGVGRSDVPPGPYTIDQMADDTAGLIRRLGYDQVRAVGWSLGGSVLQALLIRNGDVVSRAVLLSAFPSYTELQHGWLDCLLCLRQSDVPAEAQAMFGMAWGFTGKMLVDHAALAAGARLGGRPLPHLVRRLRGPGPRPAPLRFPADARQGEDPDPRAGGRGGCADPGQPVDRDGRTDPERAAAGAPAWQSRHGDRVHRRDRRRDHGLPGLVASPAV